MKTPNDFVQQYMNTDPDGSECVGGFKIFMRWLGIGNTGSVGSAKNYASGKWPSTLSNSGFIYFTDKSQLKSGDWYISDAQQWSSFYNPHGHVAMYYVDSSGNAWSFGKNQGRLRFEANVKFSSYAPKFLCAYRPKIWASENFVGSPINGVSQTNTDMSDIIDSSQGISTAVTVDYTKLNPYIIELNRNSVDTIDLSKVKDKKVVGVLIEGGRFFDDKHQKEKNFRNPKLVSQMKKVTDAQLPFGLYMVARAKSIDDVKQEMYEFGILLRKYHTNIGAWIKLELQKSPDKNKPILDRYKQEFEWLGLKYKIGFMATEADLESQIKWSDGKYKDDWMLWVNNHVQSLSEINKLLDPMFFDIPYTGVPDTSSTATIMTSTNLSAVSTTSSMGSVTVPKELDGKWKTGIASAYGGFQDAAIADNQGTATGDAVTENSMGVAIPMAWNRRDLYMNKHKVYIRYKGKVCLATINDCGGMGGGSRHLDLQPGVTKFFGIIGASNWGLRTVEYIIV